MLSSAEERGTPIEKLHLVDSYDLQHALDHLRRGDAMDWPQRRAWVRSVREQLSQSGSSETALSLLLLLADDSKWEVRCDVANCLAFVPEDEFPRLAAKLISDSNAFVQRAAQAALDHRQRGQASIQRQRRGLDHIEEEYACIEKAHGTAAAEKSRRMAEKLYDVLVGATVHDMRNILSPMKSSIAAMLGHTNGAVDDHGAFQKNLRKLDHQAEILERMLDDMRHYAQPTPADPRLCRLADVSNEAHVMVQDAFGATGRDPAGVDVSVDVPENLSLRISRHQIVRAISNVIKNAYESFAVDSQTFTSGRITLTAAAVDDRYIEIVVHDNGMGLSPDELADVRRFVPGGTSKKIYGTGFGLPIAKRKIEGHGGSLAIDSEEDNGTTVIIMLPVNVEEEDG